MQIVVTRWGKMEVEQSWVDSKTLTHIVKLAGGGYAHSTGLPIKTEDELREGIKDKKALEEALEWFRNRDNEAAKKRAFKLNPDGEWTFDDGSPIESLGDIISNTVPGPAQDALYAWFKEREKREAEAQEIKRTALGKAAEKVAESVAGK